MHFGLMDLTLLHSGSTCFGYSCGHLQGGENKNININKMCLHRSII